MSKQLHKNFTDGQVKSLFEKYSKGEIKLNYILSCQFLESREVDSLNYWPNIEMTQITPDFRTFSPIQNQNSNKITMSLT